MIGSLRGQVISRSPAGEILIEVGGVGYRVTAGPATSARLGDPGDDVFVWVHHHIREDQQVLYGFASESEREAFEALLGAHGVGPALALAILSVHSPDALAQVIARDDVAALCLVPGVGKKTAARLLIELKSRLDGVPTTSLDVSGSATSTHDHSGSRSALTDVRDGLAELGYGSEEIAEATRDLAGDDPALLLKVALRRLASGARR